MWSELMIALWSWLMIGATAGCNLLVIGAIAVLWSWLVIGATAGRNLLVIGTSVWSWLVFGASIAWSWALLLAGIAVLWSWLHLEIGTRAGVSLLVLGGGMVFGASAAWSFDWYYMYEELEHMTYVVWSWLVIGTSGWSWLNALWNWPTFDWYYISEELEHMTYLIIEVDRMYTILIVFFFGFLFVATAVVFLQKRRRRRTVLSLPCFYVPMFADPEIITLVTKTQKKHNVEFTIMNYTPQGGVITLQLSTFHSLLYRRFSIDNNIAIDSGSVSAANTSNFFLKAATSTVDTNTPLQRSTLCCTWLYVDDYWEFVPYTPQDSARIESMYRSGKSINLMISGRQYSFNFTSMEQINVNSGYRRSIQRQLEVDGPASSYNLNIQIQGAKPNLQAAVDELKEKLRGNLITKEYVLSTANQNKPSNDVSLYDNLLEITSKYFVETKIIGGMIVVRGMRSYIKRVRLTVGEKIAELPDHWEPQHEKIELKVVKPGSLEWEKVESDLLRTLPFAQIDKLERIQNKWLWDRYTFSKQRMREKNCGVVNEKELFHGTSSTLPEKVFKSEHGFDFRFSSRGLWGEGAYFAENAQYSNSYAYKKTSNVRQLILAKVLTGEACYCEPDKNLRQPPLKTHPGCRHSVSGETFEDERYDSVSGYTKGSKVFIIYDHDKAYPAYLITYYHL